MRNPAPSIVHPAASESGTSIASQEEFARLRRSLEAEAERCRQLEKALLASKVALAAARAESVQARVSERRAHHLAQHDGLTALPNRACFIDKLEKALPRTLTLRQEVAVMYLDLDGFKPINDQHGHSTGDELLRIIGARLGRAVRADDLVGRLGGDEFALLVLRPSGREQLDGLARQLVEVVAAPLTVGALQLSVRSSIGTAISPVDAVTPSTLLRRADAAMYLAKQRQCGVVFFDERRSSADRASAPC